jgi:hypothetical protein
LNATLIKPALSTLDDDAWDDLLSFIEERRVIPIVGPELLLVETDRGPRLLHDWLAEKLAAKLSVDVSLLPHPYTLNDVVCWFLSSRGRREEAYVRLRGIMKDAAFEPPLALKRLAAITDFDVFVSTTFDSLLEEALNSVRFAGAPSTQVLSYAPNRPCSPKYRPKSAMTATYPRSRSARSQLAAPGSLCSTAISNKPWLSHNPHWRAVSPGKPAMATQAPSFSVRAIRR